MIIYKTVSLVFKHITQQFLHRCGSANSLFKVYFLNGRGRDISEIGDCQNQPEIVIDSCPLFTGGTASHLAYLVLLLLAVGVREETWCCSMLRLWSCRFSTSLLSFRPGTSGQRRVRHGDTRSDLTRLEEHYGLHAGELRRVDVELAEDVQTGLEEGEGLGEGGGEVRELRPGEDGVGGWRAAPLYGAEQEELGPALLQQQRLVRLGQGSEGGEVLGPADRHEEQPGRCLVHCLRLLAGLAPSLLLLQDGGAGGGGL